MIDGTRAISSGISMTTGGFSSNGGAVRNGRSTEAEGDSVGIEVRIAPERWHPVKGEMLPWWHHDLQRSNRYEFI